MNFLHQTRSLVIVLAKAASMMLLFCFATVVFAEDITVTELEETTITTVTEEVPSFDVISDNSSEIVIPEEVLPDNLTPIEPTMAAMSAPVSSNDGAVRKTISDKFYAEADPVTGGLVYRYQLYLPPGRNGLTPNLSLIYSSQSNEFLNTVGYGWDFDIPTITRINKTGVSNLYQQNYYHSSIDGELVRVSSSSNSYVAKVDQGSFNKYEFDPVTSGWTVKMKDGSVLSLGTTPSTRIDNATNTTQIYQWFTSELRDANGNFNSYSYYKNNGFIYPYQVSYTSHATQAALFTVTFTRQSRSDVVTSNAPGFMVKVLERINGVNVTMGSTTLVSYNFTYGVGDNSVRSVLASIAMSGLGTDGSITTPPATQFTYKQSKKNWTEDPTISIPVIFDKNTYFADVNGDALVDIIQSTYNSNQVYINKKTGWVLDTSWSLPVYFVTSTNNDLGVRIADINGDGLNDLIKSHNSGVATYLNTGTGWTATTTWNLPINIANSSFNDLGVRFADVNGDGLIDIVYGKDTVRGVYLNTSFGWATTTSFVVPSAFVNGSTADGRVILIDVDADGLADFVSAGSVYINNGNNWVLDTSWIVPAHANQHPNDSRTRWADINGDGLVDILHAYNDLSNSTSTAHINTGAGWQYDAIWRSPTAFSTNAGGSQGVIDGGVVIADMNGDGLMDMVQSYNASAKQTWLNNNRPVDFLEQIIHPEGGATRFEYKIAQEYQIGNSLLNTRVPYPLNTVSAIGIDNGKGQRSTTTYQYSNGLFYFQNPLNKQFAGFNQVTISDPIGAITKNYYHQGNTSSSSDGEFADSQAKIGKVYRTEIYDASNQLLKKSIAKWDQYVNGSVNTFVKLAEQVFFDYEGDSSHRDSAQTYTYDNTNGNQLSQINWGEVSAQNDGSFTDIGTDRTSATTTYATSIDSDYIVLPNSAVTADQNNQMVGETKWFYDNLAFGQIDKGNQTKREDRISSTTVASTTTSYNAFGLPTSTRDPRGNQTNYSYDAVFLYVSTTTNPLSHNTFTTYNYSFGLVATTTTPNNARYVTTYDGMGRVINQYVPATSSVVAAPILQKKYQYFDVTNPYVKITAYINPVLSRDSFIYYDGLGRVVQERNQAEDINEYIAKTYVYLDNGLLQKETLPYFSTGAGRTTSGVPKRLYLNYSYDALGRVIAQGSVIGTTSSVYTDWVQTKTDANGHSKQFVYDAKGNLVNVNEYNGTSTYLTRYEYDAGNRLTKITDATGNIRSFSYDMLGRRTRAEDLHSPSDVTFGIWSYTYDLAGNLTRTVNPASQTVNYTYDALNRMLTENESSIASNDKVFTYDSCSLGLGFLCTGLSLASATSSYTYTPQGQPKTETKVVSGTTYTSTYDYDWAGNRIAATYPNASVVSYTYNKAGLVESISVKKPGATSSTPVVLDFDYSPTGQVTFQKNSNNTETINVYDQNALYRLVEKRTTGPGLGLAAFPQLSSFRSAQSTEDLSLFRSASTNNPVAIDELSTLDSRTYYLGKDKKGNNTYKVNAYQTNLSAESAPINMSRMSGAWTGETATYKTRVNSTASSHLFDYLVNNQILSVHAADIKYRAVLPVEKVDTEQKVVKYEGAFGTGTDIEISFSEIAITKDIVFNTAPVLVKGDIYYTATFKLVSTSSFDIVIDGQKLSEYKTLTTPNEAFITTNKGIIAMMPAARAIGSGDGLDPGNQTPVQLRFEQKLDGVYVTKLIPSQWLASAVYPVRADFTLSTYTGVADGYIQSQPYPSSWATQQSNTTGLGANFSSQDIYVDSQAYASPGGYLAIFRGFFPFDTSVLPDNASVTGANLKVYVKSKWDDFNDSVGTLNVYQSTQAQNNSLVNADFGRCGDTITNPTKGASDIDITSITTNSYLSIPLNVTGRSWASTTGFTKLCMREGHDASNQPTNNNNNTWKYSGVIIAASESTGTSTDPYLELVYTLPNSAPVTPISLMVEATTNPTNILQSNPRFSAEFKDNDTQDFATHYQIQVATNTTFTNLIWDSTKTAFNPSIPVDSITPDISYGGTALVLDGATYYWRIKFWDDSANSGAWSTGLDTFTMANNGGVLQKLRYTYDPVGNITSITDQSTAIPVVHSYSYDDLDRLIRYNATGTNYTPTTTPTRKIPITVLATSTTQNLTNFPVYVDLATLPAAFWSYIRSDGGDIRVTDAVGTHLPFDLVSINRASSTGELYFKAPSVVAGTTTTFFIHYGALTMEPLSAQDPYGSQAVWNGYKTRWHFQGTTSSAAKVRNSVGGAGSLTEQNSPQSGTDAQNRQNATYELNGANQYLNASDGTFANAGSNFTLSVTMQPTSGAASISELSMVSRHSSTYGYNEPFGIALENGGYPFARVQNSYISNQNTTYADTVYQITDLDDGQWHQVDFTYDYYYLRLFVDGNLTAIKYSPYLSSNTGNGFSVGKLLGGNSYFAGKFGEVSLRPTTEGEAWVKATYRNRFTPTQFYSVGSSTIVSTSSIATTTTNYSETYSYSPVGNITNITRNGVSINYTYTQPNLVNPHAPTAISSTTLTYDNNGNLRTMASTTYTYAYNNLLSAITTTATTTYRYDHQGSRTQKITPTLTTTYISPAYEVTATTSTLHLYNGDTLITSFNTQGATTTGTFVHPDHLGSTNVTTGDQGHLTNFYSYTPYGAHRTATTTASSTYTELNQFIGQDYDPESTLSYLNARYYDSGRGQFTNQDPMHWTLPVNLIIDPQLQNSYGYGRNNPIVYKDANGELPVLAVPIIVGGVVGALGGIASQAHSDWTNGGFTGVSNYGVSALKGATVGAGTVVAGTLALASGGTAAVVASGAAAGTLTAGTEVLGNYVQNNENDYTQIAIQSSTAAVTGGVLSKLPKVRGVKPRLVQTILTGKHTQRAAAEEGVSVSNQLLTGNAYYYYSTSNSSSNSRSNSGINYNNAYRNLSDAQRALERGDLKAAKAALSRANNNLNNKKK
jgi:RHS repeat-associated protein